MRINIIHREDCCGCSACAAVCPVKAITMKPDCQGFLYPDVDSDRCVDCGLCQSVCGQAPSQKKEPLTAYAVKNIREEVQKRSSSGGVSHGLCRQMIAEGGVVYGVRYDEKHRVVTARADSLEACDAFYGSKYVQTDPCDTFTQVYEDLMGGRKVLYFGTSCHIAGLLSFCQRKKCNMEGLLTVDLICHGVPSPKLYAEYIALLGKKKAFHHFEFRTKELPWGYGSKNFGCTVFYTDGKKETDTPKARAFLNLFFSNHCLRPSCYGCQFASLEKTADITIADYWGIAEAHPAFYSEQGVSAVITHTAKADAFLRRAEELFWIVSDTEKIARKQGNLQGPSLKGKDYDAFWKQYEEKGFPWIAKVYGGLNGKQKIKYYLKKLGLWSR